MSEPREFSIEQIEEMRDSLRSLLKTKGWKLYAQIIQEYTNEKINTFSHNLDMDDKALRILQAQFNTADFLIQAPSIKIQEWNEDLEIRKKGKEG